MSSSVKYAKEYARACRNWDLMKDPDAYRARAGGNLSEAEERAIILNEDFLPLIRASRRSSRQGVLLEIIELNAECGSDADRQIFTRALSGYRGYRRGFKRLVRLVEQATKTIERQFPTDGEDAPYFWGARSTTRILYLLEVIAAMDTDESHGYLMSLSGPSSHPAIRIDALESMHAEKDKFDPDYVLRLITDPCSSDAVNFEILYVMLMQSNRFKSRDYIDAILPFIDHPVHDIFDLAVSALGTTSRGEHRLRRRYVELRSEGKMEPDRLARIASQLGEA